MRFDLNHGVLEQARERALNEIDKAAAEAHARITPSIRGQEAIYEAKRVEATAYRDAGYPEPIPADQFPWITQEVTANGMLPIEVADAILTKFTTWQQKRMLIETIRVSARFDAGIPDNQAAIVAVRNEAVSKLREIQ